MPNTRKVTFTGLWTTPLNRKAFTKLIRHYYKGKNDIHVRFDKRIGPLADHQWDSKKQHHLIRINPKWCGVGKSNARWLYNDKIQTVDLVRMNKHDKICKIIWVFLHEIRHAMQRDKAPMKWHHTAAKHTRITQSLMSYKLSAIEADAEGWALMNVNKAIERYESWCK